MPRHYVENKSVKESTNSRRSGSWKNSADYCAQKPRTHYSVLRLQRPPQSSMPPHWQQPQLRNEKLYDKSSLLQRLRATLLHKLKLITGAQRKLHVLPKRQLNDSVGISPRPQKKLRGGHQGPRELRELSPPKITSRHAARAWESVAEGPHRARMMYRVSVRRT